MENQERELFSVNIIKKPGMIMKQLLGEIERPAEERDVLDLVSFIIHLAP